MKEELIQRANAITNVRKQYNEIYQILDLLSIPYKKTTCKKCLMDYLNIIKEELGIIESAADNSSFNNGYKYKYVYPFRIAYTYNGKKYIMGKKDIPIEVIEEFIKTHPNYYKKIKE